MRYLIVLLLLTYCKILLGINIELNTYNFYGTQSYTELHMRVDGNSVEWSKVLNSQQSAVNIIMIITTDDGNIAAYDKFTLTSTTKDSIADFFEIKRIKLIPNRYKVRLEVNDEHQPTNKIELEQTLVVEASFQNFGISDILPLSLVKKDTSDHLMVRNGFYMEPLSYHFSSPNYNQLDFYIEIYHLQPSDGEYYIQYAIMEGNTKNINSKALLTKYKKLVGQEIEPMVLTLPVNSIKSGDYHLTVNVIGKNKEILASRHMDFVRSNPTADIAFLESFNETVEHSFVQKIDPEDMDYVLKALLPITDQHQVSTLGELLKSNRIKSQRQFIYQLWKAKSPTNPAEAHNAYMEVAKAVDKKFYSNVGYGFQSDRGHIFLKYGKPTNVMSVDTEVDAPPYEIWYYNNLVQTRQTNVRFLFYNPSLAHNDYKLLHSTCLGERVNPAWEVELYKSVPLERKGSTIDATQVNDNWNRNARRYFNEY